MSAPVYAIGDIHGQIGELDRVLRLIARDGGDDAYHVFLGDYVDRGPDSKAVIETLIEGTRAGRDWHFVRGNHDRYLTRFWRDMTVFDPNTRAGLSWLDKPLGGATTLASYGVSTTDERPLDEIHAATRDAIPEAHIAFLEALPLIHQTEHLICVHAGLRPGVPLDQQREDDLVWIRKDFLEHDDMFFGKLVVHGHTSIDYPMHAGNRVNLDGGAGHFRPLHAAVFEDADCWLLTDRGRVPLRPD